MPNAAEHVFATTAVPVLSPSAGQAPAAQTAAVAVLAAPGSSSRWHISQVDWSYSGVPGAGATLIVAWTDPTLGSVSRVYGITNGGPGQLHFLPPLFFPLNAVVTFTLSSGGASVVGTIYPSGWTD
jgi:hypothetical protein